MKDSSSPIISITQLQSLQFSLSYSFSFVMLHEIYLFSFLYFSVLAKGSLRVVDNSIIFNIKVQLFLASICCFSDIFLLVCYLFSCLPALFNCVLLGLEV